MKQETEQQKYVLAFGFFDGVHIGHGALLRTAVSRAAETGAMPAVLTFDTHPDRLVHGHPVPLINSGPDRDYLLRRFYGIEQVFYIRFDAETMHMSWDRFLDKMLDRCAVSHFVVGYDFRFGNGGEGTAASLAAYCASHHLGCDIVPPVTWEGEIVHSAAIRELLTEGKVRRANVLLGHPHLLTDVVRQGFHIGRKMHFPTINMRLADGVLSPRHGVYAARVQLPEGPRDAIANIGVRPTFDDSGERLTVETHIYDYEGELYGQQLCVEFHEFIRPEQRFPSQDALQAQIARDLEQVRAFFKNSGDKK